jgi:hypothetical protein
MTPLYEVQNEIEKDLDRNNRLTASTKRKGFHF